MAIAIDYRSGASGLSDLADTATPTVTGADIGTASADRYILYGINGRGAANRVINSVTIDGVAMTAVGAQLDNSGNTSAFYIASKPTGTTADFVINLNGVWVRAGMGVWALTGVGSVVATDRQTDTTFSSNVVNVSMSCPAGGAIFGLANNIDNSSQTNWTWAGITENWDVNLEAQGRGSGASLAFASAQSGLTVSGTRAGGTTTIPTFLVIALGPVDPGQPTIKRMGGVPFSNRNLGVW